MTKAKQPVKNADLWRQLDDAMRGHRISWQWLKGHAGHAGNERCDELARTAIEAVKQTHGKDQLAAHLADFVDAQKPASLPGF